MFDARLNPNFEIYRGDARDKLTLKPLVKDADIIIPLAGIVGAPMCDADKTAAKSTNSGSIITLIKMLSIDQHIIIPITNSATIGNNMRNSPEKWLESVSYTHLRAHET